MNSTNNFPVEDMESGVAVFVTELQRQLNDSLKQLSPERLQVLADFAAYLANAESEAATQEPAKKMQILSKENANAIEPAY